MSKPQNHIRTAAGASFRIKVAVLALAGLGGLSALFLFDPDGKSRSLRKEFAKLTLNGVIPEPHATSRVEAISELAAINQVLATNPASSAHLARKVHLALDLDRVQAIEACRTILVHDPQNSFALGHLASAYLLQGQSRAALRYALQLQEWEPGARAENLIATIHLNEGRSADARRHFERALAYDAGNEEARRGLEMLSNAGAKTP